MDIHGPSIPGSGLNSQNQEQVAVDKPHLRTTTGRGGWLNLCFCRLTKKKQVLKDKYIYTYIYIYIYGRKSWIRFDFVFVSLAIGVIIEKQHVQTIIWFGVGLAVSGWENDGTFPINMY